MANNIALFKQYLPFLDEVYKSNSLTAMLDGSEELAQAGANADEMIIPMIDMQGLADYSRANGYVNGDVTLTLQTVKCNFDRGRMFQVDALDDAETAGLAFGRLCGEFIRTKVVPELDAFRMASYASKAGVGSASGNLTTGAQVVEALRAAVNAMDEQEVPFENRYLFITPTLKGLAEDMDTTKSRAVLGRFTAITAVPQSRMYSAITQSSEGAGGYAMDAEKGKALNFLLVHKDAVIQYQKHIAPKVVPPESNPMADAWRFGYRNVGIADVYANKLCGVYAHKAV